MQDKIKGVVLLLLATVCLGVFFFNSYKDGIDDNENTIKLIQSHIHASNIVDLQNEISVNSPDDVKWYYSNDGKVVNIKYGKMLLRYKLETLLAKENKETLNSMFLEAKWNKKKDCLEIKFQGVNLLEHEMV